MQTETGRIPDAVLRGGTLVMPDKVVRSDLRVRAGRIALGDTTTPCERELDLAGKVVVPGFVDIHFHGFNLFDFTNGLYDPKEKTFDGSEAAHAHGVPMLRETLCQHGVTGFFLASFAAPVERLRLCFDRLADYLRAHGDERIGARLFGGLLEGTFINPDMAGAQDPAFIFEPSRTVFDRIAASDVIKLVAVAPEYDRASCELIATLTERGIVAGGAHTCATSRQWAEAVRAGLRYCLHFPNGPTGGSYKSFDDGGSVEAVLQTDAVHAELLFDGYHVHPSYIRDIVHRKGSRKIVAITDGIFASGAGLSGEFAFGGVPGIVSDNGEYFAVAGKPAALYGANLTMDRAFQNALNWLTQPMPGVWTRRHEAMAFEDALIAAARICATNACDLTGLRSQGYGALSDGAAADLCVLEIDGTPGEYRVRVDRTLVDGDTVYAGESV